MFAKTDLRELSALIEQATAYKEPEAEPPDLEAFFKDRPLEDLVGAVLKLQDMINARSDRVQ